jgi:hypothetical protein
MNAVFHDTTSRLSALQQGWRAIVFAGTTLVLASAPLAQSPAPMPAPLIHDVESAFARIQNRGKLLTARSNGLIPRPRYRVTLTNLFGFRNHFQGVQRPPTGNYLVISGSNRQSSDLFVVRFRDPESPGDIVAQIAVDPTLKHAGGLSMFGSLLAVPLHGGSPLRAQIVFYDLANPEQPRRLPVTIERPGRKASATAITCLVNGRFLVAVLSAYDGLPRRVDLYLSRSTTFDDGFAPEPATWRVSEVQSRAGQERTFSHFQAINFIRQTDGRLYLVGFHNSGLAASFFPARDYADLYEVIFPLGTIDAEPPVLSAPAIVKVANRQLQCRDGYCDLDAAAGLYIDPDTQSLSVYATPGWLDGDTVKLSVYPGAPAYLSAP